MVRVAGPALSSTSSPPLPAGLRARVWIASGNFFSREDTRSRCWLWLHRHDGRVQVVRTQSQLLERDDLLESLVARLDSEQSGSRPDQPLSFAPGCEAWRLPDAPVVPVPRWKISWGHPVQRAIRAFAATLDMEVMQALGDLEAPGPFLGSAENYSRLATLDQPVRSHRLQALSQFPPLVTPLLLDVLDRPDLFGDSCEADPHRKAGCNGEAVLFAIDRGRDLIGALAAHYRVDRALVRSPLCRAPWAAGAIPAHALRLFAALPAHARPRRVVDAEARLKDLESLPFGRNSAHDISVLAGAFAQGWNQTWTRLDSIGSPVGSSLYHTRDFLAAALAQTRLPESLVGLPRDRLGLAWVARRGLASLLLASRRWHAQPQEEIAAPPPDAQRVMLEAALEPCELKGGVVEELLSEDALVEEGSRMQHCVGDYWFECLTAGTRIFHLELTDGERATAGFELDEADGGHAFELNQLSGPRNAPVSGAMTRFANHVLDQLNAPERNERRALLAESAAAAARIERGLRVPRRWIRRLDLRSRRELALVLAWCEAQESWKQGRSELYRGRIAGFQYHHGARLLEQLQAFDALELVREAANPHDGDAVRVDWRGHKLGYIPRAQNRAVAQLLDHGAAIDARVVDVSRSEQLWSAVEILVEHRKSELVGN